MPTLFRLCGSDWCAVTTSAGHLLGVSKLYMIWLGSSSKQIWWHCFAATGLTVLQNVRGVIMWL